MSKARDLANAGTALGAVTATELGYVDGVTSAIQTQIDSKIGSASAINPTIVDAKGDIIAATAADTVSRLAVGTNGQVLTADSTEALGLKWATASSGVTTFTNRIVGDGNGFNQIAYNGSNLYVAVGDAGKLYTSADRVTWTSRTSGFGSNNIRSVVFGNSIWVAVGQNGTITTSTDGITWTARTSNMSTNIIQMVVYDNSLFVAVGNGGGTLNTGGITYSTDGITWTRKSQSITVGTSYNSVVWNGTNWVVGSTFSTNNYLYASTPSGTWTAGATAGNGIVCILCWDGTRHTFSETSLFGYSTSTTFSGAVYIDSPGNFGGLNQRAAKLYNGKLYFDSGYTQIMTPASLTRLAYDTPFISPTSRATTATGVIGAYPGCLYIDANGYIIASNEGYLWTS